MTVAWPETLPGPLASSLRVSAGTNAARRRTQSGRVEVRRFGAGAPDLVDATFHLLHADVAAFRHFHERTCNLGLNWFTAPWLAHLGYLEHCARIVGHPRRTGKGTLYSDYACRLAVRPLAEAWADTFWPAEAIAGPGPEPAPEGRVVGWANGSVGNALVAAIPAGLTGVDVSVALVNSSSTLGAMVVRADGTVAGWGSNAATTTLVSGWAAGLGAVARVWLGYSGGYFLSTTGVIGHFGSPQAGTNYPQVPGIVAMRVNKTNDVVQAMGVAQDSEGSVHLWGAPAYNPWRLPTTVQTPLRSIGYATRSSNVALVDDAGNVFVPARSLDLVMTLTGQDATLGLALRNLSYPWDTLTARGLFYRATGAWFVGSSIGTETPPDGLVPLDVIGAECTVRAIRQDGLLVCFGAQAFPPPVELTGINVVRVDYDPYQYTTLALKKE